MQLADGTLVKWDSLRKPLTEINRASRMNLLAVMSMCHGGWLISQLQPVDVSPVWGLIGPFAQILSWRLQEAFQAFYSRLFSSMDGRATIQAMNQGHEGSHRELKVVLAEAAFCKIWRLYEKDYCSPEKLKEREDSIVAYGMRQSGYDLRSAIHGRPLVKDGLSDKERSFQIYRRSFLMIDLFPENESRFPMTYQNCVEAA